MKMFYVGTALCVIAGLVVVIVDLMKFTAGYVLIAIPIVLVGFVIQMAALLNNRPSKRFPRH